MSGKQLSAEGGWRAIKMGWVKPDNYDDPAVIGVGEERCILI